jgi:hypothetical protein
LKESLLKESPLLEFHLKDPQHFAFKEAGIGSLSYSVVQSEKKKRYIRPQINREWFTTADPQASASSNQDTSLVSEAVISRGI